jgi:3-oxoacyl-[acyl-carrier protein] reductase
MSDPLRHAGRVAVVTGAAMGLGRAYAKRLVEEGATVLIADLADGTELAAELGDRAHAAHCDVSSLDDVVALAAAVAELGGADILVHNAAIFPLAPFEDITYEDWRRVLAVNLDSMFLLTQAFLPHMRTQQWGRIVGIASGMVHAGVPGAVHYVASKGGIIGFVRGLCREIGPDGITINAISPGLIRTEGTSTGVHDERNIFELALGGQAIKRTGQPDDLAGALSFLVSDEAGFVTGQTWVVDGGKA